MCVQVQQQQLKHQVDKLELKFTKVANAHELLHEGIRSRQETSRAIRRKTEEETSAYFNL